MLCKLFSHPTGCLCIFVSFAVQKPLVWCSPSCLFLILLHELSSLTALARISSNTFNRSGQSRQYCFVFTIERDVSCEFVKYGLYFVEVVPSVPNSLRVFIVKGIEFYQMLFLHLLKLYSSFCLCGRSHFLPLLIANLVSLFAKIPHIISSFLSLLRLILWPKIWYTLKNVQCVLEKNVYSDAIRWYVLYMPVRSIWSNV